MEQVEEEEQVQEEEQVRDTERGMRLEETQSRLQRERERERERETDGQTDSTLPACWRVIGVTDGERVCSLSGSSPFISILHASPALCPITGAHYNVCVCVCVWCVCVCVCPAMCKDW